MSKTSCEHEARVIAKNLAELHSALMDQPDATADAVNETMRRTLTEIDRLFWERVASLQGHYCPDWDGMWVTRNMPAWAGCTCADKRPN